jgi:hypothetical protein
VAGLIIPFLDKRSFEFSYLGNAATQDVVLHPGVEVSNFYRVRAVIRIHSITATTGNFTFKFQHTAPSDQDPAEFTITTDFMTSGSITTASPNIATVAQTDPYSHLKIILRATQGTSGNTLYGEFSAFLVVREN